MNTTYQEDLLNIDELDIRYTYGTFWPRFWALLLDGLILAVLTPLILYSKTEWKSSVIMIILTCIRIAYKPFFEYQYGATPGKMALKLKVVNYQYGKASLNEIFLRNIFQIAGGLINLVLALFAFYEPALAKASSLYDFTASSFTSIITIFIQLAIFILYLVDLGFLLNSADSRSLHDRIGKTFVIKVQ